MIWDEFLQPDKYFLQENPESELQLHYQITCCGFLSLSAPMASGSCRSAPPTFLPSPSHPLILTHIRSKTWPRIPLATLAMEAGRLPVYLHFSFFSSKSNAPVLPWILWQTSCCDLASFSVPSPTDHIYYFLPPPSPFILLSQSPTPSGIPWEPVRKASQR